MADENRVLNLGFFYSGRAMDKANAIAPLIDGMVLEDGVTSIRLVRWENEDGENKTGIFAGKKRSFLDQFYRKIHSLDGAIVLLTPDEKMTKRSGLFGSLGRAKVLNDNVLMELGACIAKFGKGRTFILIPDDKSVRLPTYFTEKTDDGQNPMEPLLFSTNPKGKTAEKTNRRVATIIGKRLHDLGNAAFFSDLPSFGLADGYVKNFLAQLPTLLWDKGDKPRARVQPTRKTQDDHGLPDFIDFNDFDVKVLLPSDAIRNRDEIMDEIQKLPWGEFVIEVPNGRDISVTASLGALKEGMFQVYEVPSNLIPSQKAIASIEDTWFLENERDTEYQASLEQREIDNFRRFVTLILADKGELKWLTPEKRAKISIEMIETLASLKRYV